MLKISNLTIEYRKLLFNDISFTLGNKEKIGLIGLNGCGKSTLLKILAGIEQPDSGKVEIVNEKIAYLPQEYSFIHGTLVGEILESLVDDHHTELYKVNRILDKLEFKDIDWYQDVNTLSHGQKMKLYISKLLIKNPTILLLDEPTNHLDIYGILWLEKFIKEFDGICMIVSHDRAFLNNVINKVYEIDEQKLNMFEGNYDEYLVLKDDLIAKRRTQFLLQEKKREKFEDMIVLIRKSTAGEKQARALKAAKNRMEREVLRNEIDLYKEKKIKNLSLKGKTHNSKLVLKIKDLSFGYSDKRLLDGANFEIYGKEKVWFYGENGIGKSTLVKLAVHELSPIDGIIQIGENLRYTYFSQDQSHLDMDQTVEDYFLTNTTVSYFA